MAFALFTGNPFEVFHFGCDDRRSNEANVIELCQFSTALIIFDEYLDILNVLEFNITQIDHIAVQIFRIHTEITFGKMLFGIRFGS